MRRRRNANGVVCQFKDRMPRRSTTASNFFRSCNDLNEWNEILGQYDSVLARYAAIKRRPELIELDRFRNEEYAKIVNERNPPVVELAELSKLTTWKLLRGNIRPLQKMVDGNEPQEVVRISREAIELMKMHQVLEAVQVLCRLKGIGPASATGVLAPLFPDQCPFLADEVLEVCCGRRDYSFVAFQQVHELLQRKVEEIGGLNVESVGKVLWTVGAMKTLGEELNVVKSAEGENEVDEMKRSMGWNEDVPQALKKNRRK